MVTDDKKREFALRLLECRGDAQAAALRVEPFDIATRLWLFTECVGDPVVLAEMDRLVKEFGHDHFLPNKAETAAAIFDVAAKATDTDSKLRAFKLYADVMGFIEKGIGNSTVVNNNNLVQKGAVVVIRDFGTDDEWEVAAKAQQARLIHDASDKSAAA